MLGILVLGYACSVILLNIPYIQQKMAGIVSDELSQILGSELTIRKVDMGLLNRIIIDDLLLQDQSGKEMFKISRLSAKFDILPLFNKKISISSVQLFGFNISLNKPDPESPANLQFVIDAFSSKDTVQTQSNIDLRINSVLIRRGKLSYDVLSEEETPGKFNPNHVRLQNIIANFSLKALQSDSINAAIKRFSVEEHSGIEVKKLNMKLIANDKWMRIENFITELPGSTLQMDTIRLEFDSLGSFNHFADDVRFSFQTLPTHITLKDISPFAPVLSNFKEKIGLDLNVSGTLNQLLCSHLEIRAEDKFRLQGNGSLQDLSRPKDALLFGKISYLYASSEGIDFLVRNLSNGTGKIPPLLTRLGNVSFNGEVSGYFNDLVTYGLFRTDIGYVKTDVKLSSNKEQQRVAYSGTVKTTDFQLGHLLDNKELGLISLDLSVQGSQQGNAYPSIVLKGLVPAFEYSNYTYKNITLDGEYIRGGFNGKMALNDENGSVSLNGAFNIVEKVPTFRFLADIHKVRPHKLNLLTKYPEETEFSFKLKADFSGASIDKMIGEINVDSLYFSDSTEEFHMNNLQVKAGRIDNQKHIRIRSEFLTADIEGDFLYGTLPVSVRNILSNYMPSVVQPYQKPLETKNNFTFDVHILNTDILPTVFRIPLQVHTHSVLQGSVNDLVNRIRLDGYFPRFQYGNTFIESGTLHCDNFTDKLKMNARFTNLKKNSAVTLALDVYAQDDQLTSTIHWGNNSAETYSGQLAAIAHFFRPDQENPRLRAMIDVQPTDVILNDTLWRVHPSKVVIDSGKVHINDFNFSHNDRHVRIDGCLSELPEDTVKVDLKEINLGYVFGIVDISDDIFFMGEATGTAYASNVLKKPVMNTNLFIRQLKLNGGLLGDAHIYGSWDNEQEGIYLDAMIHEKEKLNAHVNGYIYPLKPKSGLDLHIDAHGLNIKFLEHYMSSVATDIKGNASGKVHFYGRFKALNLEGTAMADASLRFDILNTSFAIRDSIHMSTEGLRFDKVRVFDAEGHEGTLNGSLRYQNFKNMNYYFDINAMNMLVMNTRESFDSPFYGTVYGTGNAVLSGNQQGLNINAGITTNRNTTFTYSIGSIASATSNQFIRFVDKTPRRNTLDSLRTTTFYERRQQQEEERETELDIRINLLIDATPDASVKIIMDPLAGDHITAKGMGSIRAEFYNKGEFKMFGNYNITQGMYKFSLQEVIRKDFNIKEGSNITFTGDPYDANLGIQAVYTVPSASLNDLIPDASTIVQQPNVKVNCLMNLTGNLLHPTIKMNLELPNEREEVQTLVRNYLNTDEQMNTQILYLLGIGKFYTQENSGANQNSNVMSSVLSSTLSGQLNNVLSQVINSNSWNIGTNLSTGEKGWSEMEIEGVLSGQLLNNRLIINGNFGYRDNPMANTNFVGDFEAEWLLTRTGDLRLKAYNETNDRYYTKTNLTTQGVGLIYKKDFEKWQDLFFWNRWKAQQSKKRIKETKQQPNDSVDNAQSRSKRERE